MGIRIGIVGAGTTVAIADRHVEGFSGPGGALYRHRRMQPHPGGLPAAVYPARA